MPDKQQYGLEKEFLAELLKQLPFHVFWKNIDGVYLGCNDIFAKSHGFSSPEALIGKTDFDLPTMVDAEHYRADDQEVIRSRKPKLHIEESQIFTDGQTVHLITSKIPLFNEQQEVIGVLGIYTDITERKQAEQELLQAKQMAESANVLKTEFIQNMQHDIRTPIAGICSLLDMMVQADDLQVFKPMMPYAAQAAQELLGLCNEVIDFENIEYGKKPIYTNKFSLLALVHSIMNLNSVAAISHQTRLSMDIAEDVPDIIKGDDYRLKKILINLLSNAIKFTEQGEIKILITLAKKKTKNVVLRFSVIDTGIGIPSDKLNTIFEKFTRLNPSNTGKFKGSGLGLHIVKKFADEMGAEIEVHSTEGKGTEFIVDASFDLPLVAQLAHQSQPSAPFSRHLSITAETPLEDLMTPPPRHIANKIVKKPSATKNNDGLFQICLIEDDTLALNAVEALLTSIYPNCTVSSAMTVSDSIALLRHRLFDLVISDIGLPDGTGFDIIQHVKCDELHPNHKTRFIALTAHSEETKRAQALALGFEELINKPLSLQKAQLLLQGDNLKNDTVDTLPAVDFEKCIDIAAGKTKTALDLLNMLADSFEEEKQLIQQAFENNNFLQARELFHKLRGGISYVCVPQIEKLSKELHEMIKTYENKQRKLTLLMPKIRQLFEAMDAVSTWLNTQTTHVVNSRTQAPAQAY